MTTIAQKAIAILENRLVKTATVLAIRVWEPATFIEIDLHLPGCDMEKWREVQHIKCKVGTLAYRDYTPSGWDAETRTCTLLIHAAHDGPGSRWGRTLSVGDTISYLGVESSHQRPVSGSRMVFLGDETTIGHFLALQQLADKGADISGAILMAEPHHRDEFDTYFSGLGLQPLKKDPDLHYRELDNWISEQAPGKGEVVFYLAGYSPAVVRWRKLLKQKGIRGQQVKAQGFWD